MAMFGYFCLSGIFQMSEELTKQLNSYKAQLQQVEVALSTDPENEDLQKLQKDLQVCTNTTPAVKRVVLLWGLTNQYNIITSMFYQRFVCQKHTKTSGKHAHESLSVGLVPSAVNRKSLIWQKTSWPHSLLIALQPPMALHQFLWSTTGKLGTSVWLSGVMMDSKYCCQQCCAKFLVIIYFVIHIMLV